MPVEIVPASISSKTGDGQERFDGDTMAITLRRRIPFFAAYVAPILLLLMTTLSPASAAGITLTPLGGTHHAWARSEFSMTGVPAAANPYDPDVIAVDISFTGPSGKAVTLPAFWYQPYSRSLDKDSEKLAVAGEAGWRVRWTPVEPGTHRWKATVTLGGKPAAGGEGTVSVGAKPPNARGFVRVEPRGKRYFQMDDGSPLPLLGECACWHGKRGTYDYDDWFAGFCKAGMNYTRLWMWNVAFGIEFLPGERLNYNQERAWRLDYVLDEAQRSGIYVMLCLDYHGIFNVTPDMWGGNDWWPRHAYNAANGGPSRDQNGFFTDEEARKLYRKRLRYLIGRYSSQPSLMSWQFFNEINNVYRFLKPADVVAWHDAMAQWLKANDPYRHPITTSFGSAGEDEAMWKLPSLDYAQYHLYMNWTGNEPKQPSEAIATVSKRFRERYDKPMYFGEFGTHGSGTKQMLESDPKFRGLQQGIWGGIFGGTAGTAMTWWWETVHANDLYPLWGSLSRFLAGTGFGSADWRPMAASAPKPSKALGAPDPNARPITVAIPVTGTWGAKTDGPLVLRGPSDATESSLNAFLHGSSKEDLRQPFAIKAVFAPNAKIVVHVNSVSTDPILTVLAGGKEIFRRVLPNKDGGYAINNEYNEDFEVSVPAGVQEIEVRNAGADWINIDRVTAVNILPTRPPRDGGVPLDVHALTDGKTALVWAIDPDFNYPRGGDADPATVTGGVVTLTGLPDGEYEARWWNTREGGEAGSSRARSVGGTMRLPVPDFKIDTAARIRRR